MLKAVPMKNLLYLFATMLALVTTPPVYASEADAYIASYSKLLAQYMQEGEKQGIQTTLVDYVSWGKDPLHIKTLEALQKINPKTLSNKEKMAFWINAYNLLTIDLIIKTGEKESIRNQGNFFKNAWKSHVWEIHNKRYTLDEIEHQILRPMGDPRIHMAINCASLSCPNLRAEPFQAAKLDDQLEEQVQLFIKNQSKAVLVTNSGLKISEIFKWFAEDFGGNKGVIEFIHKHLPQSKNTKEIDDYFDYNWSLNLLRTSNIE